MALIEKCLTGRSTTREKALQALLLFMQIGALEPTMVCILIRLDKCGTQGMLTVMLSCAQTQLLKGCTNKVAKVAACCLYCLKEAVRCPSLPSFLLIVT